MSYPPVNNYYGSTTNAPNDQRYLVPDNNSTRTNFYQSQTRGVDDGQQNQYGAHRYAWNGQEQNTAVASSQNAYSNDSWNNRSSSSHSGHYQRDIYAPSNQVTNSQRYQSRDPYNSQNTQGLNHLAYASGLDSSASLSTGVRSSSVQPNSAYGPPPTSHTHIRTASPANYDAQYPSSFSQQKSVAQPAQSDNTLASTKNPDLALDAAAALADVVRSKSRQSNRQSDNVTMVREPNSLIVGNTQTKQQVPNRTTNLSNSVSSPTNKHSKKPSSNSRPAMSSAKNQAHATVTNTAMPLQVIQSTHSTQSPRSNPNTEQQSTQANSQNQRAATNPQSIANLVSNSRDSVQEAYSMEEVMMPNYIDPSQVFNPYHREHERKKREVAEAEVRRKAEEQRLVEEKRKANEVAATNTSSVNSRSGATIASTEAHNSSQTTTNVSNSIPDQDAMAMEMQKMMEKMKEFRNKDPALFQKLWKDMRGNSNNMGATIVTQSPSPQTTRASVSTDVSTSVGQNIKPNARATSRKSEAYPTTGGIPPNGFKVVLENNPEGLPDLGRFPAERRIRTSYAKTKSNEPTGAKQPQNAALPVEQQVPVLEQVSPTQTPRLVTDPTVAMPEPRRKAIAVAAINLLKSNPDNAGNPITAQEICSILEQNPPYLDLCNALEARGLKFQRTTFARELLKSVPGLSTPAGKASGTPNQKAATVGKPVTTAHHQPVPAPTMPVQAVNNHSVPQPLVDMYGAAQTEPHLPQFGPMRTDPSSVKMEVPKPFVKPSSKSAKVRPPPSSRPEPPAGSKEAAARKRDFNELIDLTALNDNENYVPTTKQPRLEPPQPHDPFKEIAQNLRTGFSNLTSEPLRFNPRPQPQAQAQAQAQVAQPHAMPPQTPFRQGFVQQPHYQAVYIQPQPQQPQNFPQQASKSRMILATKIDKSEALQKSYYDPKTVARDILIASGRHPSERPLNLHLAGLIGGYIDLDSDVSTFDWDAVDPGGPPPTRVAYVDVPAAPPRFKLGERVRRRMKRTEASDAEQARVPERERRQVGPGSGTPAQSQAPSPAPSSLYPTSVVERNRSDSVLKAAVHRQRRRRVEADGRDAEIATPSARRISIDIPISSLSRRPSPSTSRKQSGHASRMEVDATPTSKRRGRPPGSKNKYPSVAAMKQQAKAVVVEAPAPASAPAPALPSVEKAPEPVYHSYKCKWVKCYAELHNVETLRRHVLKKHAPAPDEVKQGEYVCWWKKCQYLEPDGDGNMAPMQMFKNQDEWMRHVEEDHIEPIALKYGDGPRTSQTGKQKLKEFDFSKFLYKPSIGPITRTFSYTDPQSVTQARNRYLADSEGRATTPLVTSDGNSEHPPDAMILTKTYTHGPKTDKEKADITAHNAFMKAHGNKHQDGRRAAEEVVRAMEARKKKIGPGLDRGGCTLVNEARRSTLIQAPGISRIVDCEY